MALRFTNDPDAARDVTHDAFVWLLGKFPGFELRAQMKTVLYPVLRNIALTRKRRPGHGPMVVDPPGHAGPAWSADAAALNAAVQELPAGQREVLMLRYGDDLPLSEIAAALGIPVGTVKSRLHLALQALREQPGLKEMFGTE